MLVSALLSGGPPRRVLDAARDGAITLVVPETAIEEVVRVLGGKLGAGRDAVIAYVDAVRTIATIEPSPPARKVTGDPADDAILACAVATGAEVLVTGDRRHLLPLETYHGVRILAPQTLLADIRRSTPPSPPGP